MASSLPYAAPYSRSAPQARPSLRINSRLVRLAAIAVAVLLLYTFVQLYLASIAAATLHELARLEAEIEIAAVERDALLAQVEEMKNPAHIEARARDKGYRPLASIEFIR